VKEVKHSVQQLEKEVQRLKLAVEELSVLNDLAIAASSSLEVRQLLDIIVQKSIKAVKAEQGSISLVTEQEETPFRTLIRQVDRTHDQMPYRIGAHITGWILKNKQPLMIDTLATDGRFKASEQEAKEIRSVLCVPIWSQAKLIGILMMMTKKNRSRSMPMTCGCCPSLLPNRVN
jgi:GAF domain-containing protein